jgi:hypothetical protein
MWAKSPINFYIQAFVRKSTVCVEYLGASLYHRHPVVVIMMDRGRLRFLALLAVSRGIYFCVVY